MEVYIIGAGGNCKIIIDICRANKYHIKGIFDDYKTDSPYENIPILGTTQLLAEMSNVNVVNSIGDITTKRQINACLSPNLNWINCIHPNAYVSNSVRLGVGNIICYGAVVNSDAVIGDHNLINTRAIIEHDCIVGNYNHFAPNSTICGGVVINDNNLIGTGASIIPNITVGSSNIIGAMAAIINNQSDRQTVVGVPGKVIKQHTCNLKSTWPQYDDDMIEHVADILRSGKVNQWTGTLVRQFEDIYANYFGTKHAIAISNGTAALEICLHALKLKKTDQVIVTSRSFIASASAITLAGATPIFVDVDPNSQNITLDNIINATTEHTKAVILVHLAGWPCDVDDIVEWCHSRNIYVVEDCAQSHGAKYKDKYLGTFGDINAWSFCQDKIISTGGEGGMITTNNTELYNLAWSYKDHGKNLEKVNTKNNTQLFRWIHDSIGTNARMTEIQASIGIDSLVKLEQWIEHRRESAEIFNNAFADLSICRLTIPDDKYYHCYYKYYFFIRPEYLAPGHTRNSIIQDIRSHDIVCSQGSCGEINRELAYDIDVDVPVSKELFDTAIMLCVDPSITHTAIQESAHIIRQILKSASVAIL